MVGNYTNAKMSLCVESNPCGMGLENGVLDVFLAGRVFAEELDLHKWNEIGMGAGKRASDHCWIHGRGQLVGTWLCQLAPGSLHSLANAETFVKCLYNSVSKTIIGNLCV